MTELNYVNILLLYY